VSHPSEVVRPGQEVEVAILSLDAGARRISLSMNPLEAGGLDDEQRAKLTAPEPAGGGGALADALQRALTDKSRKAGGRSD
jgi:predicted RNA-binding protein with RPS1 domain